MSLHCERRLRRSQSSYYVLSSDIPGLHVETETFEDFVEAVCEVAPDLMGDQAAGSKIYFEREIELAV